MAEGGELWTLTSPQTRALADQMGYLASIEAAGGHIMGGTCSVMSCWDRRFVGKPGVSDSLKARVYNSKTGTSYKLMRMEDGIEAALVGECR